MLKAVQYFTDEYLERCKTSTPDQILEFLENFRTLQSQIPQAKTKSKLISIKIPEDLLLAFKFKAEREGVPYQTLIKQLMTQWIKLASSL